MDFIKFLDLDDKVEAARKIGEYFAEFNQDLVNYYKNSKMPKVIEMTDIMKKEFSDDDSIKLIDEMVEKFWSKNIETFEDMVRNKYDEIMNDGDEIMNDGYDRYYNCNDMDRIDAVNNLVKNVIFKCFVQLLSNPDMLIIYKDLYKFRENKVVTDPDIIKRLMRYCFKDGENSVCVNGCFSRKYEKIYFSTEDYPTKFNKIRVEQFDECPFYLDMICLDFDLDDKYLGDNYVFKKFNPVEDPLIKEEMYKSYENYLL